MCIFHIQIESERQADGNRSQAGVGAVHRPRRGCVQSHADGIIVIPACRVGSVAIRAEARLHPGTGVGALGTAGVAYAGWRAGIVVRQCRDGHSFRGMILWSNTSLLWEIICTSVPISQFHRAIFGRQAVGNKTLAFG